MSIVTPKKPRRQAKSVDSWEKFSRWSSGNDDTIDEILTSLDSLATELRRLINASTGVVGIGPHGATHLPNGSDPISTAIAGSILPDDTAAVGTANFLSRSDHRHAITTDVPTIFGNAASEGVATAFARSDHVHLWPDRLRENTNGQTIILTDNGTRETLTFSRASVTFAGITTDLTISSPGGIILPTTGTAINASGTIRGKGYVITSTAAGFGVVSDWFPSTDNAFDLGDSVTPRRWKDGNFAGTVTATTFSGTFSGSLGAGNFTTPAFVWGSAYAAGTGVLAVQHNATLQYPPALRTLASGLELVATDSLGAITLTAPGSIRLVAGGAGNIQLVDNTAITGTLGATAGVSLNTSSGSTTIGRAGGGNIVPFSTAAAVDCGLTGQRWGTVFSVAGNFTGDLTMGAGTTIAADDITGNDVGVATISSGTVAVTSAGGFSIADVSNSLNLFMSAEGGVTGLDRTLTWDMGGADRTITFSGSPTLADWFNQSVKTTASPTFAALTITDAGNVVLGTTTGTKFGTATTQKIGFFNKTPVVQPAAYTPTNVTTDRSYDADTVAIAELADVVGTLIADLQSLGLVG